LTAKSTRKENGNESFAKFFIREVPNKFYHRIEL